jgi:hypothetical protein
MPAAPQKQLILTMMDDRIIVTQIMHGDAKQITPEVLHTRWFETDSCATITKMMLPLKEVQITSRTGSNR